MPEVASVGLTEEEARKENDNIKVSKFPFMANGKALGMGEIEGMVKIIADGDTLELLGVHILGAHASDLIAEAVEEILGKPIHLPKVIIKKYRKFKFLYIYSIE